MSQSEINSKNGAQSTVSSEEFDRMPLKQRLKLLFSGNRISVDSELKSERIQKNCKAPFFASLYHMEFSCIFLTVYCFDYLKTAGRLGESYHEKNSQNQCARSSSFTASGVSEIDGTVERGSLQSLVVENPVKVKLECGESNGESCLSSCMNMSNGSGIESNSDAETSIEFLDELDHVLLKDRLKRLLARFHSLSVSLFFPYFEVPFSSL